jgi:hypothetical protein
MVNSKPLVKTTIHSLLPFTTALTLLILLPPLFPLLPLPSLLPTARRTYASFQRCRYHQPRPVRLLIEYDCIDPHRDLALSISVADRRNRISGMGKSVKPPPCYIHNQSNQQLMQRPVNTQLRRLKRRTCMIERPRQKNPSGCPVAISLPFLRKL